MRPNPQGGRPQSGVRAAARELGVDRNEARRAVRIASIAPEAREAAREAGLDDNQSVLLRVAAAPREQQVEVVAALVEFRAAPRATTRQSSSTPASTRSSQRRRRAVEIEPVSAPLDQLGEIWRTATERKGLWFRVHIDYLDDEFGAGKIGNVEHPEVERYANELILSGLAV